MIHQTEVIEEKQTILIVSKSQKSFVALLKNELKRFHLDVYISPIIPQNINTFYLCFLIDEEKTSLQHTHKIITIFIEKKGYQVRSLAGKTVRIIGDPADLEVIDKLLWFALSQSKERFLTITSPTQKTPTLIKRKNINWQFFRFSKRQVIFGGIVIFLIIHLLFFLPLFTSSYFLYRATSYFKTGSPDQAYDKYRLAQPFLSLAKKLYAPIRPTYLLFSLALPPDNLFDINDKTRTLIRLGFDLRAESRQIELLIQKKDKRQNEITLLENELKHLGNTLNEAHDTIIALVQKLPKAYSLQLSSLPELIEKANDFVDLAPTLLAKDSEKKYLILFANNMELRPGGGFIGSFGILTFKNMSLQDWKIYDVYDADGQLKPHIDPPDPIRLYLQQPHYFLRDSAFSPDFLDNYAKAKYFLQQELNISDFNGAVLFTTTSVQHILQAFGDLYLPDYNEIINERNFYLKAQIHSEKEFFPGSIQKKGFLTAVARQIFVNLDRVSLLTLTREIKRSLDEKQIVAYSDLPQIQEKLLDTNYWSGRMIEPKCTAPQPDTPCVIDYIFPVDANLGVNKANFFVRRQMNLKTRISVNGAIEHTFSLDIKNDSSAEVFPGGTYKNYFQLFLPKNSVIKNVSKNDVLIDDYDDKNDVYKTLGFYFEVPPKGLVNIKVQYSLNEPIPKGRSLYQLIFQKQIGSTSNDLNLQFDFNKNIYLLNHNFSPLVKDNLILYNTNLTADKIFLLELTKD